MELYDKRAAPLPEAMNVLLFRISIVSIILVAPFLAKNILEQRFALGIVGILIEGIFILNAWMLTRRGYHFPRLIDLVLFPLIICFLMLSLKHQGMIGVFWCYPAVICAYFMMPKRSAYIANIATLCVTMPIIISMFAPEQSLRIVVTLIMVSFFSALFVDAISIQKKHLEDKNAGLQAEIAERTEAERKLALEVIRHHETSDDLQWALTEAREANRAKSRFLSGMTHELRTPLNAIIGFSQMLDGRAGPLTDQQKAEYTKYILTSGDRLHGLINQALDLAGIEAGKISLAIEEVGPRSLIERVLQEVSGLASAQGVTLVNDLGEETLPCVLADQARMTQALVNLIHNAIKYNRDDGTVRISAAANGDFLRLSIADTGIGIPEDRQDEVFETFNRLGLESSGIEGSGVGLSLTKEFIEKMGGRIGFESINGTGSTFWFELPLSVAPSIEARAEASTATAS